jgi:hypothetical protein
VKRSIFGAPQSKKLMEARLARILADDQAAQRSAAARLAAAAANNPVSSCRMGAVKRSVKEPPATSQLTKVPLSLLSFCIPHGGCEGPIQLCLIEPAAAFGERFEILWALALRELRVFFVEFGAKLLTSAWSVH